MKYKKDIEELLKQESTVDVEVEVTRLHSMIEQENSKLQEYKLENLRRKHNYIPFIVNLMQVLAAQGKLSEFYEQAKKKTAEREIIEAAKKI